MTTATHSPTTTGAPPTTDHPTTTLAPTTTTAAPTTTTEPATTTTAPPTARLTIYNFMFLPSTLTISVGTIVTVSNKDSVTHTWSDPVVWDPGDIPPGASFSYKFGTKGTFKYMCLIHTFMTGTIIVS